VSQFEPITPLTPERLSRAITRLTQQDTDLATVVNRFGPPPLWARDPGFPTLIHIILEQQVSLASARAAFDRLRQLAKPLTPEHFLAVEDELLRQAGFSRQKMLYARHLAAAIHEGRLDLAALAAQPDEEVRSRLVALKGIGPWTADIYLLMALGRPDVWPVGDLALQLAMAEVKRLPTRPTSVEMEGLAEPWRPWRAVAARILWHHYLQRPRR
jgi:DNA-3-methyladenine glycosylase II